VAGNEEPVTSPDQHKPGSLKAARVGAVITIVALLAMILGNNEVSGAAKLWLVGISALLAVILLGDWLLRKNGLRS
jgi:hypothetical protein